MIFNKSKRNKEKIEKILNKNINKKFDIIFLDPPFKNLDFINNLKFIKSKKFYNDAHVVIIHRERKTEDDLNGYLKIIDTKEYGRSKIIFGFFKKVKNFYTT